MTGRSITEPSTLANSRILHLIRHAVEIAAFCLAVVLALSMDACDGQTRRAGTSMVEAAAGGFRAVSLRDPGFGMAAYTLEIPVGWKFEGEVRRDVGCSPQDPFAAYRVTSADGLTVIQVMTPFFTAYPAQFALGMDFSRCGVFTPAAPTGQLLTRYIVPAIRKGAEVVGSPEPTPDLQQWRQQSAQQGQFYSTSGDASRVKVAYTENGHAFEEWIVGMTVVTRFKQGGGFSKTVVGTVRAPKGYLDDAQKNLSWALKLTANPDWAQREQQRQQQSAQQAQANGERTRSGIAAQAQANMNATAARTQQTIDQIHATGAASMNAARNSENARHASAVGTADYVGDRPTTYYRWRNTVTGATQTTNNATSPGPDWVAY